MSLRRLLGPCFLVAATCLPAALAAQTQVQALAPGQTRVTEDGVCRLRGEVLDSQTGAPAAGLPVALYRPRATSTRAWPEPWVPDVPDIDSAPIATVRAASEGQFMFDGLEPGNYRVVVLAASRSARAEATVSVEEPSAYLHLTVRAGATVRGTAKTEDGQTLGGVYVFAAAEDDGSGRNLRMTRNPIERATSGPDGRFVLSDLPTGAFWLQAGRRDYGFSAPLRVETRENLVVDGLDFVVRDERERIEAGERDRGGIGVGLGFDDLGVTVTRLLDDMPAAEAGILPGDRIVSIEGRSTLWMTRLEFMLLARGAVGARVTLTLSRDGGAPFDVTVQRARMPDK
ncbi:MAG: carboxypeptidase regulatory-like domain-containing protein [Deltaproteobacteria bacterium]|nr:carboxypeptidase regulatory-like domain-containing protein [Deltaproteobacteria bacterium]